MNEARASLAKGSPGTGAPLIRLQGPSRGRSQVVPSKQPLGHTEGATHAKEAKLMVPNEVQVHAGAAKMVGGSHVAAPTVTNASTSRMLSMLAVFRMELLEELEQSQRHDWPMVPPHQLRSGSS